MAIAQGLTNSPTASVGGSATWLGDLRGLLGDSFGMYLQYEAMQKQQNPTLAVVNKQLTTELANGSATVLDPSLSQMTPAASTDITVFGVKVNRTLAYISGGLLGLVLLKKAKVI